MTVHNRAQIPIDSIADRPTAVQGNDQGWEPLSDEQTVVGDHHPSHAHTIRDTGAVPAHGRCEVDVAMVVLVLDMKFSSFLV
jgi:hypothetical protein